MLGPTSTAAAINRDLFNSQLVNCSALLRYPALNFLHVLTMPSVGSDEPQSGLWVDEASFGLSLSVMAKQARCNGSVTQLSTRPAPQSGSLSPLFSSCFDKEVERHGKECGGGGLETLPIDIAPRGVWCDKHNVSHGTHIRWPPQPPPLHHGSKYPLTTWEHVDVTFFVDIGI